MVIAEPTEFQRRPGRHSGVGPNTDAVLASSASIDANGDSG